MNSIHIKNSRWVDIFINWGIEIIASAIPLIIYEINILIIFPLYIQNLHDRGAANSSLDLNYPAKDICLMVMILSFLTLIRSYGYGRENTGGGSADAKLFGGLGSLVLGCGGAVLYESITLGWAKDATVIPVLLLAAEIVISMLLRIATRK